MIAVIESTHDCVLAIHVFRNEHHDAAALKFAMLVAEDIEQADGSIGYTAALDRGWAVLRTARANGQTPYYVKRGSHIEFRTNNIFLHGEL